MDYNNVIIKAGTLMVNTVKVSKTLPKADERQIHFKKYINANATNAALAHLHEGTDMEIHCNNKTVTLLGKDYFVPNYRYNFLRMQPIESCNRLLTDTIQTNRGIYTVEELYKLWLKTKPGEIRISLYKKIKEATNNLVQRGMQTVSKNNLIGYSRKLNLLKNFITDTKPLNSIIYFDKNKYKYALLAELENESNKFNVQTSTISDEEKAQLQREMQKYNLTINPMYDVQYMVEGDFTFDIKEFSAPQITVYNAFDRVDVSISGKPEELKNFKYVQMRYKEFTPDSEYNTVKDATAWLKEHEAAFIDHTKFGICLECGKVYNLREGCPGHMLACTQEELTALAYGCGDVYNPRSLWIDPEDDNDYWYDRYNDSYYEEDEIVLSAAKTERVFNS